MEADSAEALAHADHSYPLLFATVSGAHLYGFPSPDSDVDLRGVHRLPLDRVLGLEVRHETVSIATEHEGREIDLVTHDVKKFLAMLLKRNGYVLEQLYSPIVVSTSPEHDELKTLANGCITRHHGHHYLGFARTQWDLFLKERPHRVKPLLYLYRVLLTGIHLMRTGRIEANLLHLNDEAKLPSIADLTARKLAGPEKCTLDEADVAFHDAQRQRLTAELEQAMADSRLPDRPTTRDELNDLLVRVRLDSAITKGSDGHD